MFDLIAEIRNATRGVLTEEEIIDLAPSFYTDLEAAVGMELASRCTSEQLAEFDRLSDRRDEAGLAAWIDRHQPDYPEVVREELDRLLRDLARQLGLDARSVGMP